jgi:ABC-type sugar transport system substrate-binding protein
MTPTYRSAGVAEAQKKIPPQGIVSKGRKIMTVKTFVLSCACAVAALGAVPTLVSSDKPVIALSNAYYGNAWRHQMVDV